MGNFHGTHSDKFVDLLLVLQLQTIKMNKQMVILFYLLFDDLFLELNKL